jgi:probable phosphoglycerate mutase
MDPKKFKILKRFYFVRHGQTIDNINNIYQSASDPLTEKGVEQASLVAARFVSIPADIIIASDYVRARQTAEAIAGATGLPLRESAFFEEIRRPSDIIGREKQELEPKRIMDEIIENEPNADWHHLDEENLFEALARARKAIEYLCGLPEEKIIVVSHGMFIKMMLAAMAVKDDADAVKYYRMMRYFMIIDNTGITIAEYGNFVYDVPFRLRIWNDHAHLG